ncbi:MAG TPA: hypothetical protein VHD87_14795 [Acidimicrobiales bacterium]|nr:hypothetical protein [Acidimicrobiales bacterium]
MAVTVNWYLRQRDGEGGETVRAFCSRRGAIQAARYAERNGRAVWWEVAEHVDFGDESGAGFVAATR